MKLDIGPLRVDERQAWQPLAQGYMDFYKTLKTAADYDTAWARLLAQDGICGTGARIEGRLVGIAHYFFHTAVWASTVCYLLQRPRRGAGFDRSRGRCSKGTAGGPFLLAHARPQHDGPGALRQGGAAQGLHSI
jgi:hypothetical protein